MEQLAPSFQQFIKRTPPILDHEKPFPPPPLIPRRASTSSPSRSGTPFHLAGTRSSSLYSRTYSQKDSDRISWRSADFADEPMPVPHALAYSSSTPFLLDKQPTPQLLQPRTYNPLIGTPSPTLNQITPSASLPGDRTTCWPAPIPSVQTQKKDVQTISLEEAKAIVHGPGAVHLLPEELRAKTFRRSRSDEALRIAPIAMPSALLETLTLVDSQGRRRTIVSPKDAPLFASVCPSPVVDSCVKGTQSAFKVGNSHERAMVPLATQQRNESKDKVVQALGLDEFDEPRGRTRRRGPRNLNCAHYLRNGKSLVEDKSPDSEPEAQRIAKEYHALLSDQYRKPSDSSGYHSAESDDKIRAYMKMIPKPLFQNKPPAKLPGHLDRSDDEQDGSPYSLSPRAGKGGSSVRSATGSDSDVFPLSLSITTETAHQRHSTSGSIPISPPEPFEKTSALQSSAPGATEVARATTTKRRKSDSRVSAYYPHVISRKGSNTAKGSRVSRDGSEIPPMPLLGTNVNQREGSTSSPQSASPRLRTRTSGSSGGSGMVRTKSDASSNRTRQPFRQRVVKGATSLFTQPELPEQNAYQHTTSATISPDSPHPLPSPAKSKSKEIHLGWSDAAKTTFDKVVSPTRPTPKSAVPTFTHVVAPARPLDETKLGLKDVESPRRKNSMFSGLLESWKESKAEKRREELKKMIKFVPYEEWDAGNHQRSNSTLGWM